jgi:hypothetical protein
VYRKEKGHVLVLNQQYGDEVVKVTRDEVAGYVEAQDFLYFLSIYQYTKLWGMPNGNGWANEPTEILDGITALELEAKAIEAEQYKDKKHPSGKNLGARRESI